MHKKACFKGCLTEGSIPIFAAAVVGLLPCIAVAQPTVINYSATIGGKSTVDYDGLFGPVGADLAGEQANVVVTYTPSSFEPCNGYVDCWNSPTQGAITLSVTINGLTQTQTSVSGGINGQVTGYIAGIPNKKANDVNLYSYASPGEDDFIFVLYQSDLKKSSLNDLGQPGSGSPGYFYFFRDDMPYEDEMLDYNALPSGQEPQICMGAVNVTNAKPPTPVAIGQQIVLSICNGDLPNVQSQKWDVQKSRVGGYALANVVCGGDGQTACPPCTKEDKCVADVIDDKASVMFYWLNQDDTKDPDSSHSVSYSYTLTDGTNGDVSANFHVEGPSVLSVAPNPGPVTVLPHGVMAGSGNGPLPGGTPGNQINASLQSPQNFMGSAVWLQIINDNGFVYSNPGSLPVVLAGGLDKTFPYQSLADGGNDAYDYPMLTFCPIQDRFDSYTQLNVQFDATMFLMWKYSDDNSIPVVLGSIKWGYTAAATRSGAGAPWNGTGTVNPGSFMESNEFPFWKRTARAGRSPCHM